MRWRLFVVTLTILWFTTVNTGWSQDKVTSENLLPGSTRAWVSIPDTEMLFDQLKLTSLGRLAETEVMQPFVKQLEQQAKSYLDRQNVHLGITIDDLREVRAAEICVAGVLPKRESDEQKLTRGLHGLVILVDVSGSEDNAEKLLKKVEAEMESYGATREQSENVLGASVSKWKLPTKEHGFQRYTYHTLTNGWLVASDNDAIFRDVIRRLKSPEFGEAADTLANNPTFRRIMETTSMEGVTPHARWYIEPFGYIELAQAIADEESEFKQRRNDHAAILKKEGFDALKGLGGILALNQGEHDLVHRTFVHAVSPEGENPQGQRAISMLDFRNKWDCDFKPEVFIGDSSASYFTFTWDMKKAYDNIGPIFDAFLGEQSFEKMVESFRKDLNVDLSKLVSMLGNRVAVVSNSKRPIDERSERLAFLVPIKEQPEVVDKWVEKLVGGDGEVNMDGDRKYIVIDSTDDGLDPDDYDPVFEDPADQVPESGLEEEGEAFNLFERRFVVIEQNYLVIANDWDFAKELLDKRETNLAESEDYKSINETLNKLIDVQKVCARGFGRVDRMLETNYEMLRQGKMATSQTALARILNRLFKTQDATEQVRAQKIDGSTLPENYSELVAPFLGPSAWASEAHEDGWVLTGCILKKKGLDELVKKPEYKQQR